MNLYVTKVSNSIVGTDAYEYIKAENSEDAQKQAHQIALENYDMYGIGDDIYEEAIEDGMSEEEAGDYAEQRRQEDVDCGVELVMENIDSNLDVSTLECPSVVYSEKHPHCM